MHLRMRLAIHLGMRRVCWATFATLQREARTCLHPRDFRWEERAPALSSDSTRSMCLTELPSAASIMSSVIPTSAQPRELPVTARCKAISGLPSDVNAKKLYSRDGCKPLRPTLEKAE